MSDHQSGENIDSGADLEYDLAHEFSGIATPASSDTQTHGEPIVTTTPEYHGGDYSYDLAHDIPRSQ